MDQFFIWFPESETRKQAYEKGNEGYEDLKSAMHFATKFSIAQGSEVFRIINKRGKTLFTGRGFKAGMFQWGHTTDELGYQNLIPITGFECKSCEGDQLWRDRYQKLARVINDHRRLYFKIEKELTEHERQITAWELARPNRPNVSRQVAKDILNEFRQ